MSSCGERTSSSQSAKSSGIADYYSITLTPTRFTLNSGEYASISATEYKSVENGTPTAVTPQPTLDYYTSDSRVMVSPAGAVCAGKWDSQYETCTASSTLPTGYVLIYAYDPSRANTNSDGSYAQVIAETEVSIHQRPTSIQLTTTSSFPSSTGKCVSVNSSAQYIANPMDSSNTVFTQTGTDTYGNPIYGNISPQDYTWSVSNSTVASVDEYGKVLAVAPGVTNVYATINGVESTAVAFATCPPKSIVLTTSAYNVIGPSAPYTTKDLDSSNSTALSQGTNKFVTALITDTNSTQFVDSTGTATASIPLSFVSSSPLEGTITADLPLTSILTANTAGRFTVTASCLPSSCNPSAGNFALPATTAGGSVTEVSGDTYGYGYPIYSNVLGLQVAGTVDSKVLVAGSTSPDGTSTSPEVLMYDTSTMELQQTIGLTYAPNSMVVAPNGQTVYLGSATDASLIDLTASTYTPTLIREKYQVSGELATYAITGKVLAISPDSRYVLLSDTSASKVFLVDTTSAKTTKYDLAGITTAKFAPDDSNFWLGGTSGLYIYSASSFVLAPNNASTNVTALAWTPDGMSVFAGNSSQLLNYSTCTSSAPPTPSDNNLTLPPTVTNGLAVTAVEGVPHLLGLDGTTWFDYTVTDSAQISGQTVDALTSLSVPSTAQGNVCLATTSVATPIQATSSLACTATQVRFSPVLQQMFVTGVDSSCTSSESALHGFQLGASSEFTLTTTSAVVPLSGDVMSDGSKLFFGSQDSTAKTATLHRVDLSTQTEDSSAAVSLGVVPDYVAVVPK